MARKQDLASDSEDSDIISVQPTTEDFAYWVSRPYISEELKHELSDANILLVPREGFKDHAGPVFPVGTEELLETFREHASEELHPDICISDDDYKELALHSALLILGTIVVKSGIVAAVVKIVNTYLKHSAAKDRVKVSLIVSDNGRSTKFSYEGLAANFATVTGKSISGVLAAEAGPRAPQLPVAETKNGDPDIKQLPASTIPANQRSGSSPKRTARSTSKAGKKASKSLNGKRK